MNKKISIIMPNYNSQPFIKESMESVIAQTYKNWELIVVDDVSTDASYEIVEEYREKDKRIQLIKLDNNVGPAIARNKGIKEAMGRYIAFLDSDDLWHPDKLFFIPIFITHSSACMLVGQSFKPARIRPAHFSLPAFACAFLVASISSCF